jgi:hypothetical protein
MRFLQAIAWIAMLTRWNMAGLPMGPDEGVIDRAAPRVKGEVAMFFFFLFFLPSKQSFSRGMSR